jgi:hypothetical protein
MTLLTLTCWQPFSGTSSCAASRRQVMRWSWRRWLSQTAAPTCTVPIWLTRAALLQCSVQAASGARNAEWLGTAALPARMPTGGRGTGGFAGRKGRRGCWSGSEKGVKQSTMYDYN